MLIGWFEVVANKLGIINYERLEQIENKIVSVKIELLDENSNFNMTDLNLEFLIRIHKFLFGDIYYDDYLAPRTLNPDEFEKVHSIFELLVQIGAFRQNLELIPELFIRLWEMQIFRDGNTRTLYAFLKIYVAGYQLPIEYKKDLNISSGKSFVLNMCQQKIVDNI
ncbi:MAG: hypothetical protein E7173_00815 [Firmicutes bacterium]|nr:hypothetical protein [Bacillota bacterium]